MFAFHNRGGSRQGTSLHCTATGHSFQAMAENAGTTAQRIRYGLTGLAIAFLVVLLGSVISRAAATSLRRAPMPQRMRRSRASRMAELGVAPGASDTNDTNQE